MEKKDQYILKTSCIKNLVCPKCKSTLNVSSRGLFCLNDKESYPIDKGIVDFLRRKDYVYTEIGEKLARLEKDIERIADLNSLKGLIYRKYPEVYRYIFSPSRADFLYLLSKFTFSKSNIFLDAGCGFGNITMYASDRVTCSYGLDATYARIRFLRKWLEIEGEKNSVPILGNVMDLPFKDEVDIILLNGVFEWVGTFETDKKVEDLQLDVLSGVHNALNENGVLVISIENRYNPFFLLSKDHSGLFFTSFFPRWLASIYTYLLKGESYRTFTYSYWKYADLLKKAGFARSKIFGCYPVYRYPRYTYSLEDIKVVRFLSNFSKQFSFVESSFFKVLSKNIFLARFLSPSFIIFGFKEERDCTDYFNGDLVVSGYGELVKVYDLQKNVVISFLRNRRFNSILSEQVKLRRSFNIRAPKLLLYSKQHRYIVEDLIAGNNLEAVLKKDRSKAMKMLSSAFYELWRFYDCQKPTLVYFDQYLISLSNRLIKYEDHETVGIYVREFFRTVERFLKKGKLKIRLPILEVHGDFCMQNIVCSNAECYIIDWESTRKASIFYDYFNLLSIYALHNNKHFVLENIINQTFSSDDFEQFMFNILSKFKAKFNLETKNMANLAPLYLIFLVERVLLLLERFTRLVEQEIQRWYQLKKEFF